MVAIGDHSGTREFAAVRFGIGGDRHLGSSQVQHVAHADEFRNGQVLLAGRKSGSYCPVQHRERLRRVTEHLQRPPPKRWEHLIQLFFRASGM